MNSPKICISSTYKNLKSKQFQSPKDLKEKLRKDYKNKVQNCRNTLLNKFRGPTTETDIRSTLTNIYNDIFNDAGNESLKRELLLDNEETEILEEIKQELIEDELNWYLEEYEKTQIENIDNSVLQQEDNVICPICQKNNLSITNEILTCKLCNLNVKTNCKLKEIENIIFDNLDHHSNICSGVVQFSAISESFDTHIYFICERCMEMKLIV